MKVLVLGAGGMAGHVISLYLRDQGFDVDTLCSKYALDANTFMINILDQGQLSHVLNSSKYDVVVNAVGVLIAQSELRKDVATYLNAYLPHFLANHYKNTKTKVFQFSTDCVFSGENPPYTEDSLCDGTKFYARTKALGDLRNEKDLTFRMSFIGPHMRKDGPGLFNWFYRQTGVIVGYTDAIWTGITTMELARGIEAAIAQQLTGLYHLVPHTSISKYELLQLFKTVFDRVDIEVEPKDGMKSDKTLINSRQDFDFDVPDYHTMVQGMRDWIESNRSLYKHYK
jgi:dTDP-4-dehydrorhamnose reductase